MPIANLKFTAPCVVPSQTTQKGISNESRQYGLLARYRLLTPESPTLKYFPIPRQAQSRTFQLSRSISKHAIRSVHLSGKFTRYRNLPASPEKQTVSHRGAWRHIGKHARQCQQDSRLVYLYLHRLYPGFYLYCSETLKQRRLWCRTRRSRLRSRFHYNRFQLIIFSLISLLSHQSCPEASYVSRSAGKYSGLSTDQLRQIAFFRYLRQQGNDFFNKKIYSPEARSSRSLSVLLASRTVFQMDQAAFSNQVAFRPLRKFNQNPIWMAVSVRATRVIIKKNYRIEVRLHTMLQMLNFTALEKNRLFTMIA